MKLKMNERTGESLVAILHEQLTVGLVVGGILIIASTLSPMWLGKLMPESRESNIEDLNTKG